jgi:hypothetical protein
LPVTAWLQPGKQLDTIDGRYGYLRLGKAIPLTGRTATAGLALEEHGGKGGRLTGQWQATQRKDNAGKPILTGTWRSPDQTHALPIEMACVVAVDGTIVDARYRPQLGRHPMAKKFQRLLRAGMIVGAVEQVGVATMNQVTDVKSGCAYPQLLRLPNPTAMEEVNAWIRKEASCETRIQSTGDDGEDTCYEETTLTVLHASGNSVTVYEQTQDDCGVHPDETEMLVTFDISGPHAIKLDLESFLDVYASAAKKGRFMRMVFKQRERESGLGYTADDGCDEDDGDSPSFSFGAVHNGILVDVDHGAHVTEGCDYQVTLPHRDVKRLLSTKAPQWLREGRY